MEGLKEALEYVVGMDEPHIITHDGETYSDKPLKRISYVPYATAIKVTTLSSLVDYIKSGIDSMHGRMIVQVVSPELVRFYSELDADRERESIMDVQAQIPSFSFDTYLEKRSLLSACSPSFLMIPKPTRNLC